ncbi:MAG: magnesium transporter MgtE N-terminal domain-containing protein [Clostridium fessum]
MESRSHKAESDGSYPEPKAAYTCICRNDSCKQRIPCVHCRIYLWISFRHSACVQEQEGSSLSDFQNDNILEGDGNVRRREERRAAGSADREKYRELKSQLVEMNEVDIASFIEELDSEKTVVVFRMLPKELASEVFACLESNSSSTSLPVLRIMSCVPSLTTCMSMMRSICWRSCRRRSCGAYFRTPARIREN